MQSTNIDLQVQKIIVIVQFTMHSFTTEKNIWTNSVVSDLNNLFILQKPYEVSHNHVTFLLTLKHSDTVLKKWYILHCLIYIVCSLAENELPFRTKDQGMI